eukprot:6186713-Pleurochrysis_carterae.AAC.2
MPDVTTILSSRRLTRLPIIDLSMTIDEGSELARGGDQCLGTGQAGIAHPSRRFGLGDQDD